MKPPTPIWNLRTETTGPQAPTMTELCYFTVFLSISFVFLEFLAQLKSSIVYTRKTLKDPSTLQWKASTLTPQGLCFNLSFNPELMYHDPTQF